jgi:hypothetical protein
MSPFYAGRMAQTTAKRAARSTRNSRPLRFLARLGYAVSGLLHLLIGVIAIGVATGAGSAEADQSGALSQLASTPGGIFLLWIVVVGLVALGVWLIINAFLNPGLAGGKRARYVLTQLAKGIVYFALALTALVFARGGATSSADSTRTMSADLLAAPGGVLLVFLIGLGVVGVGIYCLAKGATRRFTRDISVPAGAVGKATVALGVVGYVAKGIALGVVGILFAIAAVTIDPAEATGLDGALKALAMLPFGMAILVFVGVGFIAYGLYSFVRARVARM